jgi:Siphovirus Gp157
MAATTTTPLIPFDTAPAAPTPNDIANDYSLLKIDQELDFLMEQIEDEIEESGEASKEAMDRLQMFCQAMNVKVDRIGRYLAVMESRADHCRKEAARYAARAKRAQSKIDRTKAMVLYYLEAHDLKQLETEDTTLRRQKNSQDSVLITNPDAIPPDLKRYELKVAGDIWMKVFLALPEELAAALQATVSSAEPMYQAIKQCFASGRTIDGVVVRRLYHLRTA